VPAFIFLAERVVFRKFRHVGAFELLEGFVLLFSLAFPLPLAAGVVVEVALAFDVGIL